MPDSTSTTSDDSRTTIWQTRPYLLAVVAVMVLADFVIVLSSHGPLREYSFFALLGFALGQAGAVSISAFAEGVVHRLLVAVASLALGLLLAAGLWFSVRYAVSDQWLTLYIILFVSHQTIVLLILLSIHLFHRRKDSKNWQPKFAVRQLLGIMIVTALVASLIGKALPDIQLLYEKGNLKTALVLALVAVIAGVLLLPQPIKLWRFGAFAGLGLAVGYLFSLTTGWYGCLFLTVIQMATLAICLVVPKFDRFRLRVALEPREPRNSEQHLDETA